MKSILSSRNSLNSQIRGTVKAAFLLFGMAWLLFAGTVDAQINQPPLQQNQATVTPGNTAGPGSNLTQIGDIKTFWSLTKLGGGISIAIFGVFGLGIFLIVFQLYELISDKLRARVLLAADYRHLSFQDAKSLVMKFPNNVTARLYSILLTVFQSTGSTQDFHTEVANFIQMQQDRFVTFKNRLAFLSDTAGALGLLGTVWGMFVTFFGGNLDSQRILNGMGLALVTTLIGLVVSVILNLCSTEVFSIFNKRLELISAKADEFRLRLMVLANHKNKRSTDNNNSGNAQHAVSQSQQLRKPTNPNEPAMVTLSLKALSDLQLDGWIGEKLAQPISIRVQTKEGQRVAGVPIQFEIADGGGFVDDNKKTTWVKTDSKGIAKMFWTLGPQVGPQRMKVYLPNNQSRNLEFVTFAQPVLPKDPAFLAENKLSGYSENRGPAN
ncbi:MAG: MotA/TolQ/ExbB proton channel family protein [bacterium]